MVWVGISEITRALTVLCASRFEPCAVSQGSLFI